jgi:hypothetical protein
MSFDVIALTSDIASSVLAWCGVDSPTPAEIAVAELAATQAVDAIKFYRGLAPNDDFEGEYTSLAIEMAVYLWNKRGIDGVLIMSENGVSRSFEAGSFPRSMLSRIALAVETG